MLDPFGGAVRAPQRDRSTRADARDAFDALTETIWRLRQPDGCPWDREQTHQSIAQNMIEEAYEAVDCIEAGDAAHLREELGDVLMQVMLHAQIAADAHAFTIEDVVRELNEKLIRRHPHVFGPRRGAANAGEVLDIWDQVKKDERTQAGEGRLAPRGAARERAPGVSRPHAGAEGLQARGESGVRMGIPSMPYGTRSLPSVPSSRLRSRAAPRASWSSATCCLPW